MLSIVINLVPINWAKAVDCARMIYDPVPACCAFACCGRFASYPHSVQLIDIAFQKAQSCQEIFGQLAATAAPLRALIELGYEAQAEREFDRIASLASQVEPQASRGEACLAVYTALAVADRELVMKALHWLMSECQPHVHWRQKRAITHAVLMAVTLHVAAPEDLLSLIQSERLKNNMARRLMQGETMRPNQFFRTT